MSLLQYYLGKWYGTISASKKASKEGFSGSWQLELHAKRPAMSHADWETVNNNVSLLRWNNICSTELLVSIRLQATREYLVASGGGQLLLEDEQVLSKNDLGTTSTGRQQTAAAESSSSQPLSCCLWIVQPVDHNLTEFEAVGGHIFSFALGGSNDDLLLEPRTYRRTARSEAAAWLTSKEPVTVGRAAVAEVPVRPGTGVRLQPPQQGDMDKVVREVKGNAEAMRSMPYNTGFQVVVKLLILACVAGCIGRLLGAGLLWLGGAIIAECPPWVRGL
jgi:hypothetical protein